MDILNQLFIKNYKFRKNDYSNLYYSYDNESFVGFNLAIINKNKIYQKYNILRELFKILNEGYKEYKAIIELEDKKLFIRIIFDDRNLVMDILIYSIKNDEEYRKYNRIFFVEEVKLPDELKDESNTLLCLKNNHIFIVKNGDSFLQLLGFEEWDFKNKFLNELDSIMINKNIIDKFINKESFIEEYEFMTNGFGNVKIKCEFKYFADYFILTGKIMWNIVIFNFFSLLAFKILV